MDIDRLRAQLTLEEGRCLAAYKDTEGILTVGIGHNCVAEPVPGVTKVGDTITDEQCDALFEADVQTKAVAECDQHLPWWRDLDDVRQNALANLMFNMGWTTLSQFKNTLAAFERHDFEAAAKGLEASRWHKQVGRRALRIEAMVRTGEWQPLR